MSLFDIIMEENKLLDLSNNEKILSEVTIAADDSSKNGVLIYIDLDGGQNFGGDEAYFKCIPHSANIKTTNPARISFRNPIYIVHYRESKQFILNLKQKKSLINLLNSTHKSGYSVWQMMIIQFNNFIMSKGKDNEKYKLPLDLPIPDYRRLPSK